MKPFTDYQLYIFDLDNTLYNENDYLFGAYREIASKLGNEAIGNYLVQTFQREGRNGLFDKMVQHFSLNKDVIPGCLEILRTYKPREKFRMYPQMRVLLENLNRKNKRLALLTNGHPQQQKNKAENIIPELSLFFPLIVFANEMKKKPSPDGVHYILEQDGIDKENCIMIGDDVSDELTAKNAGVDFIYAQEL